MYFPTKYPILLVLFSIIFAAVTHAAPVAVSVSRVGRGEPLKLKEDAPPDNRTLKERLDSIIEQEAKLKETDWTNVAVKTKVAAYVPLLKEIDAGIKLVSDEDTSAEARQMRDWRKWEAEMVKQLKAEMAGQEEEDDSPRAGNTGK